MIKNNTKYKNLLIFVILSLTLISFVFLCLPSIRYETLATNNIYYFSIWNFVSTLFNPKQNIVVENYLNSASTSGAAYSIAITGVIALILIACLFVTILIEFQSKQIKYSYYLCGIYMAVNIANFVSNLVFAKIITKHSAIIHMGTSGNVLYGTIVLFSVSIVIVALMLGLYFIKGKVK